ncbi:radical SAM protein [Paraliomyxa miuraensis]|uniref:radical SAM protein n=1 Tax=Paraliomyxa miuraensis TaxID=376150 RepID=UPI002251EB29|nr:radical SAM protein [Paraliomyxa miuraensis]MCX4243640.1 hypothetical protein [Paraliomyxa miuraensis]
MAADLVVMIDGEGPMPGSLRSPSASPSPPSLGENFDPRPFLEFCTAHRGAPRYERVILVGDGQPLEQHGFALAEAARRGGFRRVRLDTRPWRLTNPRQVQAVVQAGVAEISVGLHATDPALHDRLRDRPGDFRDAKKCLANLARLDAEALVYIVMTSANVGQLRPVAQLAIEAGARRIDFWAYAPLDPTESEQQLLVPLDELAPRLLEAIATCRAAEVEAVIHHVPVCVLGEEGARVDATEPDHFHDHSQFWAAADPSARPRFNCLREAQCDAAEVCLGLSHAHVNRFGWELDRLRALPRTRPWRPRDRSVRRVDARGRAQAPHGHARWLDLLGAHAMGVEGVALTRSEARYPLQMPDGTRFVLVISARDDAARTFKQSRSFNLAYTDVVGPATERAIAAFVGPVLDTIIANDDGSLSLDARR